ncbi:hypothetical protein K7A41_21975 [Sphingobacterium sp. InxBP1]|nr:hypothetical protein [Sphingobacterium sp. InxBP1]MCW8313912.1 hypothetical protein [Sphingobacterium sp. InxBP1]
MKNTLSGLSNPIHESIPYDVLITRAAFRQFTSQYSLTCLLCAAASHAL